VKKPFSIFRSPSLFDTQRKRILASEGNAELVGDVSGGF
jgi:hypothetical protein